MDDKGREGVVVHAPERKVTFPAKFLSQSAVAPPDLPPGNLQGLWREQGATKRR